MDTEAGIFEGIPDSDMVRPVRGVRTIAKRSGLTQGYISRVLNGKRSVKLVAARKISRAMGITLDKLYLIIERNRHRGVPTEVSTRISAGMARKKAQSVIDGIGNAHS